MSVERFGTGGDCRAAGLEVRLRERGGGERYFMVQRRWFRRAP